MTLLATLVFGLFFFTVLLMFLFRNRDRKVNVDRRIRRYAESPTFSYTLKNSQHHYFPRFGRFIKPLSRGISNLPQSIHMEELMQQAGLPFIGSDFIVLLVFAGAAVFIIMSLAFLSVLAGAVLGITAEAGILIWLHTRIRRRRAAFSSQLGDVLSIMSGALRAGFSLSQTMELVGREMPSPVSEEFTKTVAELKLGVSLENAMVHMSRRVRNKDFELVAAAILIHRQVGGNLSRILETVSATIAGRIRTQREIKTLSASGRLSGWVLVALPFAFAGLISWIDPEYMQPLFSTETGHVCIAVGIVLDLIGLLVIRRMLNIEM